MRPLKILNLKRSGQGRSQGGAIGGPGPPYENLIIVLLSIYREEPVNVEEVMKEMSKSARKIKFNV